MSVMKIVKPGGSGAGAGSPCGGRCRLGGSRTERQSRERPPIFSGCRIRSTTPSNEVSRLRSARSGDGRSAADELDDLRDEVTYLSVKLRKEGTVSRNDYNDVRSQVDSVRAEAEASHRAQCRATGSTERLARESTWHGRRPGTSAHRPARTGIGSGVYDSTTAESTGGARGATKSRRVTRSTSGSSVSSARRPPRSRIASKRPRWSICIRATAC